MLTQILKSKRTWFVLLPFFVSVGLMLYGFTGMFLRLQVIFNDVVEDMSFGWLVPVFSAYVLWTLRARLSRAAGAPSLVGALACLPFVALALLGTRGLQVRLEQVGFIGLCITLPWAFFGWKVAKLCCFPALFLLFTIPVSTFLDVVTIHLRLIASGTAFAVLKGFGIDVIQQGTAVISQGPHAFNIDVAEPCSGLRSLMALMALTASYAWFTQPTWLRRGLLFACSVPLAVLGNVARILTICLCAVWGSTEFATGFYHDYSGYIVFIVAIACMVGCGEGVTRLAARFERGKGPARADETRDGAAEPSVVVRRAWLPACAAVVLGGLFVFQARTPVSMVMSPPAVALPEKLPGYRTDEIRYCHREQCGRSIFVSHLEEGGGTCPVCGGELHPISLGEKTVLPADTRFLKRVYRKGQYSFLVTVVIGGRERRSIHRPELCMPAQGYQMSDSQTFSVSGRAFRSIRLTGELMPSSVLSYTFFNQAGFRTASHTRRILMDAWDRSVYNRVDRWVMLTVTASAHDFGGVDLARDADRQAVLQFLTQLEGSLP